MRINKFLADAGVASRRACDKLIETGRVTINGKVAVIGQDVDFSDVVVCDGKTVKRASKLVYYMMNKPKGYVTTVSDDKGRKTVMDLLPRMNERVYPIGRLDYDTEGLLLFTNDGDLANRLTQPINEIPKTYYAKIKGALSEAELATLRGGVIIDGVRTKKCSVKVVEQTKESTKYSVTVTEGKNRQIRKIFESVKREVIFLKRVKVGDLTVSGLKRGEVRSLSNEEVHYLKNL